MKSGIIDDNRDVFWAYVVKRSDIFGDPFKLAYDGKSTLFTVEKLHLKQVGETADPEKFSFKTVRENKLSELSILMKFTGLVHLDFRNAEAGSLDEREKGPIQFLDILFAQGRSSPLFELSKSFKAVRNSFYCIPQGAGVDVKYGIELWRGLFISARVIDGFRPAINIDVSHSCFYKRQSLINLICDILNGDEREVRFHPNQLRLNTQLQPEHLNLLIPELKGVCIHTTHRNQDRIYRIKNILSTAVSMKFQKDGKEISVAEYFRDVYGPLKYPNLPLVEVGTLSSGKLSKIQQEIESVSNDFYNSTFICRVNCCCCSILNLYCFQCLNKKELVKRPGYGTVGKPIKLACNYFPLIKLQKGDIVVNRYHIDIQHPRLNDDNREIFWAYVVKRSDIFGDPFKLAYDGKSTLFTVDKLHLKPVSEKADTEKFSFKTVRENEPSEFSILMKFTGLVHLDFRNAEAGLLDEREKGPIQFLDILFAQGRSSPLFELSKSFKAVRNSFYFIPQGAGVDVKYGIDLWRGLFISARVVDCFRPAINIDVSHSCFYKRQPLINLICDILNGDEREVKFHPNQLRSNTQLQPEHLSLLIPELKGVCIHTTHRNQDRIYRIKDILSTAVSMKFERDGKEVSVAEYFHDVYGPLKYLNLPLVQVGSKSKPIYFPVELCQVANCQRYNKKLKACQTTSIIRFASTDAPTRILKCMDMVKKSNFNNDPFLKSFGVQIKAEPMTVSGRVLPPPRLEYGKGNGGRQIILTPKDGAWNSTEFKFFESASCESFGFVSFLPPHKASMLQEFCMQIVRTCRSTGIEMPDSPKFYEQARKNDTVEMVLKRIADKCDRDGIKCDLVFVALFSSEQYAQVKSCGDITLGLVTQCVLPKTISDVAIKKSYSTMLNIAMKINMKIGGINTKLLEDEVLDNYLYKNNALVIGVDVVHPSAVETHLPSIASVVGNVDAKVTKFHASVKLQPAKQELITGFIEQFSERLLEYLDVNGTAPKNIIVYRDGVSEGQFMQVLEEELSALRRACRSVATNYRPLITFIVVQKRHHARFFCCDEAAARGRGKNIPAGTVIDRVVTSPDEHDFFLCSHHGIQGTSRPTRYHVLKSGLVEKFSDMDSNSKSSSSSSSTSKAESVKAKLDNIIALHKRGTSRPTRYHVLFDESNMDANAMQSITYYLCHLYGRCARSVSIPAPVYFADLVCARARYHVLAALCARSVSIPAPVYFADLVCARARYHVLAALKSGLVEKFSDMDSNSKSSSSSSSTSKAESVKAKLDNIIALHKRVKNIMYFA
ncbi:putative protein tag-76 [Trichinella spiralis]|uniref:Protein argonaute-3 n=1 Tax=Trichinella spiralis TaxID=6334 RepID=A0A0V1BXA8_TRISP|nr:putative protein tag-76 [Trichinella spiralis]